MADLTAILEKSKPGYVFQNIEEGQIFNIGVDDVGMTGIKAIATHNLADLPAGKALVGGKLIFLESVTSADAATIQIKVGAIVLTPVLAIADMAAGKIISFDLDAGLALYSATVADTVDAVVAAFVLTGGRWIMKLDIIDIPSITERG